MNSQEFLLELCLQVYQAEKIAQKERKRELLGGGFFPELLVMSKDKVKVEIRKENVSHNTPHLHITHSDKINVSVSLSDFSILAGEIDRKSFKQLLSVLVPKQDKLIAIWNELNEKDNSIGAERLISQF